jgi:hypothetical protein
MHLASKSATVSVVYGANDQAQGSHRKNLSRKTRQAAYEVVNGAVASPRNPAFGYSGL